MSEPAERAAVATIDLEAEAGRIVERAERDGVVLRLLGGLAVRLRCPSADHRTLRRAYGDIDLCGRQADVVRLAEIFGDLGYEPWLPFNSLNAAHSQRFDHRTLALSVDVFLDRLQMCHTLELRDRLDADAPTLTLADLLLSKLQIVELNPKDVQDVLALLRDHELGDGGRERIELARVLDVCSADWGWYRTAVETLRRCGEAVDDYLDAPEAAAVAGRLAALGSAIEEAPKTKRWRLRARIGERKRWYELPEDPTRNV